MEHTKQPASSYREVSIGKTVYRVTCFYAGEKDFRQVAEDVIIRRVTSELAS